MRYWQWMGLPAEPPFSVAGRLKLAGRSGRSARGRGHLVLVRAPFGGGLLIWTIKTKLRRQPDVGSVVVDAVERVIVEPSRLVILHRGVGAGAAGWVCMHPRHRQRAAELQAELETLLQCRRADAPQPERLTVQEQEVLQSRYGLVPVSVTETTPCDLGAHRSTIARRPCAPHRYALLVAESGRSSRAPSTTPNAGTPRILCASCLRDLVALGLADL